MQFQAIDKKADKNAAMLTSLKKNKKFQDLLKLKKNPAVILGLSITGLGIIRSLGRKKIPCIGIGRDEFEIGRFSKYSLSIICPEDELLKILVEISQLFDKRPVLFPTEDEYVLFISKHREILSRHYSFIISNSDLLNSILNKKEFYMLAQKHHQDVPYSIELSGENALDQLNGDIHFPCIVKPQFIHEFKKHYSNKKAFVVNNTDELRDILRNVHQKKIKTVVQEIVTGKDSDQFSIAVYMNNQHQPRWYFSARKIRQQPISFGTGTLVVSEQNVVLTNNAIDFLQAIQFQGLAEVEFRKDSRDGKYKIIEINPRAWSQISLATACGVNMIYNIYQDLIGGIPEPVCQSPIKKSWIFLMRDIISMLQYLKKGEISFKECFNSYQGKKECAIYATDDIFPFLMFPIYLFSKLFQHKNNQNINHVYQ